MTIPPCLLLRLLRFVSKFFRQAIRPLRSNKSARYTSPQALRRFGSVTKMVCSVSSIRRVKSPIPCFFRAFLSTYRLSRAFKTHWLPIERLPVCRIHPTLQPRQVSSGNPRNLCLSESVLGEKVWIIQRLHIFRFVGLLP